MIYSPVVNRVFASAEQPRPTKTIKGVLIEKNDMKKVIRLIDKTNANGLKGNDAVLLMRLKDAVSLL